MTRYRASVYLDETRKTRCWKATVLVGAVSRTWYFRTEWDAWAWAKEWEL